VSLSAMAGRTHYSKPLLGLLETGKRAVRPEHVTAYAHALNVPADTLYGPPDDPLRAAHEWLVSDSPVETHSVAGRRVGANLTVTLEKRVVELRHLDDVIGGRDLFPLVYKELTSAQSVINEASYTERIGRRLLTVVAELAQLAGWVASDAGQYIEAQRVYLSGVSAARGARDHVLVGQLLSSLSYQTANIGDPVDAALLARSAVKGTNGTTTPVVRALLLERLAWTLARTRDHDGTRRALDAADDAYDQRSEGTEEPEWVYWLDRKEIDVMAGRCLIELGDPMAAEPLLSGAIATYTPEHAREVALYQTWLAESYARASVFDAARDTISRARKTARGVHSTRLDLRIGTVENLLPAR
jgi:hypothetical protein